MAFKPNTKSLLRRAVHEVGARTHYLAERFGKGRKPPKERMVAVRKRRLEYQGNTATIVHTLADGRRVRHTIEISTPGRRA